MADEMATATKAPGREFAVKETKRVMPYWEFAERFFATLAMADPRVLASMEDKPAARQGPSARCRRAYEWYKADLEDFYAAPKA